MKNYELYLKTIRNCSNNTSLKYISNFKKIVLRAVAKEIISETDIPLLPKALEIIAKYNSDPDCIKEVLFFGGAQIRK